MRAARGWAACSEKPDAPRARGGAAFRLGGQQLVQTAVLDRAECLGEAPEQLVAYEHLREGHHAGAPGELDAPGGIL